MSLPIEQVLPQLKEALRSGSNAVLVAEPGAGKTTRVPLALLDEPWLAGSRILMLEPRRLAARTVSRYMARKLGESVGQSVGYRIRMETRIGPSTRVEVITEGVLTRMLQEDPALEGVGLVIFDEFHERSIHADLGLALCLQSQALLREDLRILVMSATLDAGAVSDVMRGAPVIYSEGRMFPVETIYSNRPPEGRLESGVAIAVERALQDCEGDLLVFLPGSGEIRRVETALRQAGVTARYAARITPLYGQLSMAAQDQAIAPSDGEERKVVLATSIAETSLTVEGVRVVIDSGLMRVPRFSPRTGMTRLETIPVSLASADQRRGRAGRVGPGVCYRLWTEQENRQLADYNTPEILNADLVSLALELAVWGITDASELGWIDLPPAAAMAQARELLRQLGAMDRSGAVTGYGKEMAGLSLHPRLAHMILRASELGLGGLACEIAAVLGERDLLRSHRRMVDTDVRTRIEVLRRGDSTEADPSVLQRISAQADQWKLELKVLTSARETVDSCGLLLSFAYPDRIGQRREDGRYLLSNGRGAVFAHAGMMDAMAKVDYIVAIELDDQGADGRILLAAPITIEDLMKHHSERVAEEASVSWDRATQSVKARLIRKIGEIVIREEHISRPDPELIIEALLGAITEEGLELLPWTKTARQLQHRMCFMHRQQPDWPDASDEALLASLGEWLAPHIHGMRKLDELKGLSMTGLLEGLLSWEKRRMLEDHAPSHLVVPSGSKIPVDYSDPATPVLAVRLQEMFGLKETPRIGGGRTALLLHLLSPAHRPVQVTADLASFWRNTYFEVKKDLKGRYPKHYWPDDPLTALPTHRAKPRG
jgi:ATP-dependent helicase HrpB